VNDTGGRLGVEEVRSRATSGAALLGARTAVVYAFGIAANLALARLLVPRDFGLVALGTVLVVLGGYLAEGGLGAALIRREQPPRRDELEAVLALQLTAFGAIAAVVAAGGAVVGRDGLVVATMVASLPVATLRTPGVIVLEHSLRYRVIATADVVEALTYYGWALATVALGFGVWGMATAVVVRASCGSAIVLARGPVGFVRPRWSWARVRPLIVFGAKFQATAALMILREQGVNVIVAAVGGLATLGAWTLAWRVLQVPALVFASVGRVTFPAISRLLGAGEDVRPLLERAIAALAVLTGFVVGAMVGFAPALPAIVGDRWDAVPNAILWGGVALAIGAPVTVGAAGYLFAAGEAGVVALATLASSLVWFGGAAVLVPRYGAAGVGIACVGAAVVSSAMLARRLTRLTAAGAIVRAVPLVAVSIAGSAAGWLVAELRPADLIGGASGLVTAEIVLFAGFATLGAAGLRDTNLLVREALGSLRARSRISER
jgi:O-antigen/teichoic acid export membrane protein